MKRIILLTLLLLGAQVYAEEPAEKPATSASIELDKDTIFYPNANISSAIAKYKNGNYSGCLQELFSLTKKDPSNAMAYYYMAMAYTHVDMQSEAIEAYEKVIALNPNTYLSEYATKGKDCLTGGPACMPPETEEEGTPASEEPQDELDKFINSSYGDGLSKDAESDLKLKQLEKIKDTLNSKDELDKRDIEKIKEFDTKNNKSSIDEPEKIAMVSDEEILGAIKTLKNAGVNVSLQSNNPYAQMAQYQDPQMAQMSMLLGSNNNNNSMNMLPFLMSQADSGKNIDPRLMQAMIMNSMVSDINFNNNNNDRY